MSFVEQLESETVDRESILESLSLDLMKDNIEQQIDYTVQSTTDFLSIVLTKFNVILSTEEIDEDDKQEAKFLMIDFCEELIGKISKKFNLFIDETSMDYESMIKMLYTLYNFFIINRCNNVEKFLINYITKNKKNLIDVMGLSDNDNKDITTIANKKKNLPKENIVVLSALTQIVDFIRLNHIVEPLEFIETVNDGECYTSYLKDYFETATISGDFIAIMLNEVLDEDYDCSEVTRIRNNIRLSLYDI